MKKSYLILMLAFVACFFGAKADELTVANGTATSTNIPITGLYCDEVGTYSQMLYPAEMLQAMGNGSISKVTFYPKAALSTSLKNCVLEISYKEVEDTKFTYPEGQSAYVPYEGLTTCGTYTIAGEEDVLTFELTQPIEYSGDNSLVLQLKVTTKSSYSTTNFYGVDQEETMSYYYYSTSKGGRQFLPKTTFEYESMNLEDWAAKVSPESLDFGKAYINTESTLNVTVKNKGLNTFTPVVSGLSAPFSTSYVPAELASKESVVIPVKYNPTAFGEFSGTMTINCGEAGSYQVALSGNCVDEAEIIVCDGTGQTQYLPIYGFNANIQGTFSQMLYPKEMLTSLVGKKIVGVKFYPVDPIQLGTPTIELSLKETTETEYVKTGSIISEPDNLVTDLTTVASLKLVNGQTDLVFEFATPFEYNGENLAVQTLVAEKDTWKRTYFYGTATESNTGYTQWGTSGSNEMVMFLPKMTIIFANSSEPVEEHTYAVTGEPKELFGLENSWDPENAPEMQMNDNNIYEWTSEETELEANAVVKFKVVQDHAWDVSYPAENVVKTAEKHGKYTLNVTYNPETNEVVGTLTLVEEIVDLGKVYIIGNVNGNDWATNVGVEMDTEDGKIYTKTVQVRTGDVEGVPGLKADTEIDYGYFEFATKLMEGAEDWDQLAPYRFGAVSDGPFHVYKTMMSGQELSLTSDYGQSFEIEPGDYELTVDMEKMTLKINGTTLTGIEELNINNAAKSGRFNLMGQPVDENYKGIVIENGVKKIQK